jgi:hypothetical protein
LIKYTALERKQKITKASKCAQRNGEQLTGDQNQCGKRNTFFCPLARAHGFEEVFEHVNNISHLAFRKYNKSHGESTH